jgi:hypothetical protein
MSEVDVVLVIALYLSALVGATGFFLWSICVYLARRRRQRSLNLELGPDTEPEVLALYCQYLVAPQTAVREAQKAVSSLRHRAVEGMSNDFFVLLEQLQSSTPASAKIRS